MERPLISILICRLDGREEMYAALRAVLKPQLDAIANIVDLCDSGEMPIGAKRNKLLDMATGEYAAFVDDDDMVSDDYVAQLAIALKGRPDCSEMRGQIMWCGEWHEFRHSVRYCGWYESAGIFYRTPNHLNAIRIDIAREARFCDVMNVGEDHDYSQRVRPMLCTEGRICKPIYTYIPHVTKVAE